MKVTYHPKHDLLYIRFDNKKQQLMNERFDEDIVFDIGEGEKVVGIEILDASKRIDLSSLLTLETEGIPES